MRSRYSVVPLATLACLVTLSACGGGKAEPATGDSSAPVATVTVTEEPAVTEDPTATADPDLPSDDDLQAYVEAISATSSTEVEDGIKLTAKGSLARAFLTYRAGTVTAIVTGGDSGSLEEETVSSIKNGFKSCAPSYPDDCNEYTNFKGENGVIVDFAVNGKPLRGNLIVGDGKPQQAGDLGTIELVAARVNLSGDLYVVLNTRSAAQPVQVGWGSSSYRNKDGRQVEAEGNVAGPTELGSDSLGTVFVTYKASQLGGTLTFPLFSDDFYNEQTVTFQLR